MPPIRELSQSVINKIAAGEVIERPASVVKELVENAADAGATRIDVAVEKGGAELVRVVDNGCGIRADQLPLAVASHATSKIADADDLYRVATLGFRGEALASIAEVSRLGIRSRPADSQSGARIDVVGGEASEVTPCGSPVGTAVEVRNLFFNTPVRRKFLRTTSTELGHSSEAFLRIALAAPHVHFTLRHNDRPVFDLPASQAWLERIALIAGRDLAENLIWVESAEGDVHLSGYVAHPGHSRGNTRMQYLFLNGRCIRDRALQHALGEAYRGLLMTGRYAIAFLRLDMPPELVDVNVHPTKLEVRFQDSGRLYGQLLSTLRTKFLGTDLSTRVPAATDDDDPTGAHDRRQAAQFRQQVVDWAKGKVADWGNAPGASSTDVGPGGPGTGGVPPPAGSLALERLDRAWTPAAGSEPDEAVPPAGDRPQADVPGSAPGKAIQIHDRYLVAESDDGVMVIDQHALHERILYEQLRGRILSGSLESQALLVPEPVDLAPAETAAALEHRELLSQMGMKIEPFGGSTVLVTSYPAMLANINPHEVLRGLIEPLVSAGKLPDRRDLLDRLLHAVACKAAVKAGDRLAPEEVTALLEQRHLIDDPHHCPHGRPTALVFSRDDLDKHFKRI
ncbi:MAG: DNA mismatch repair endonuclease MutL [Planctomycetota bacterium]|jgi:DNA mismatch repair protein MutL